MAGDEEVGKTVGCCRGIARPSLIKHQLADIEVKPVASLLPPTTRQLFGELGKPRQTPIARSGSQ